MNNIKYIISEFKARQIRQNADIFDSDMGDQLVTEMVRSNHLNQTPDANQIDFKKELALKVADYLENRDTDMAIELAEYLANGLINAYRPHVEDEIKNYEFEEEIYNEMYNDSVASNRAYERSRI